MMFIDKLIDALQTMRDNQVAADLIVRPDDVKRMVEANSFNRNHVGEIDARMADDLRKLSRATMQFRQACVEYSVNKYKPYDPHDPDRFRRLRKQMIETGNDITGVLSHIEPDIRP